MISTRFIFRQLSPVLRKGKRKKKTYFTPLGLGWNKYLLHTHTTFYCLCEPARRVCYARACCRLPLPPYICIGKPYVFACCSTSRDWKRDTTALHSDLYNFPPFPFIFAVGRFLISASLSLSLCTSRRVIKAFTNPFVKIRHCCFNWKSCSIRFLVRSRKWKMMSCQFRLLLCCNCRSLRTRCICNCSHIVFPARKKCLYKIIKSLSQRSFCRTVHLELA